MLVHLGAMLADLACFRWGYFSPFMPTDSEDATFSIADPIKPCKDCSFFNIAKMNSWAGEGPKTIQSAMFLNTARRKCYKTQGRRSIPGGTRGSAARTRGPLSYL